MKYSKTWCNTEIVRHRQTRHRFSHVRWDFPDFSCRMRLFSFLIEDEIFTHSHAGWDFPNFSCRMRLSQFLMQDETFPFSYATWDFLSEGELKKKKNTFLRPLHYVLAVKKIVIVFYSTVYWAEIMTIFRSCLAKPWLHQFILKFTDL